MAPRKRVASRPAPSAVATLLSLPNEAIVQCLSHLSQVDRLGSVAFVNKRLGQLCLEPELLREVCFDGSGTCDEMVPRLEAVQRFLQAHSQHVRSLQLDVEASDLDDSQPADEVKALVCGCLVACGAAPCALEKLTISADTPLVNCSWLPALTALRQLQLGSADMELRLPAGISRLTALQGLHLSGGPLTLPATAQLPCSLTRLHLTDSGGEDLPWQVSRLTNLDRLELESTCYSDESMEALCGLPHLCSLALSSALAVPACLAQLTQLRQLEVDCEDNDSLGDDVSIIEAAVGQLQQLTCLALGYPGVNTVPARIARLRHLQRLWFSAWSAGDEDEDEDELALDLCLPRGPWLSAVRWLGLPWESAVASTSVLRRMPALEYLCILELPTIPDSNDEGEDEDEESSNGSSGIEQWEAFWGFAATHPPLQCLGIEIVKDESTNPTADLLDALLDLKQQRPALQIRRTGTRGGRKLFWEEMVDLENVPS